jgi:23S rRNA (adenine-N6)-dimethyltransferase
MPDRADRRRVLSQNFLVDRRAIDALVDGSGVGDGDLVLDIGAGNGLISTALARRGARVQAIERDPALAERLRAKFATWPSVTVAEADVLTMPLPAEPFRVVANIPFGITTKILRRLLDEEGLARADMIVQAEVARKRGTRGRGTLLNACWEPWFEFGTGARIPAAAFRPRPRVDAAVLIVTRRDPPLVDQPSRRDYTEFVTAAFEGARPTVASALARTIPRTRFTGLARELGFGADALPSQLDVHQWAGLFRAAGGGRGTVAPRHPAGTGAHRRSGGSGRQPGLASGGGLASAGSAGLSGAGRRHRGQPASAGQPALAIGGWPASSRITRIISDGSNGLVR